MSNRNSIGEFIGEVMAKGCDSTFPEKWCLVK